MSFLTIFIFLTAANVIFSTIKSIVTVKGGKVFASLINGLYYAYYNIVLIYTVQDFPMWQKCFITFVCNVLGVWFVKFIEEKIQKEELWKVELSVKNRHTADLHKKLETFNIPHNYIENVGSYTIFNIYCATKKESLLTKRIADRYNAKYFVSESKIL